ncbi:MAG TPA: response regulator [Polyangiales bacterium]|nr:response regulator [Polyangiales bacterium]
MKDEALQDVSAGLVLLIEDNDDHAELVRRALLKSGRPHELMRLEDGEQALSFLLDARDEHPERAPCALILLDLRLPRMDGLEVLRRLRQAKHPVTRVPVVVLTTSETETDIAAAYAHGAHAYVVKPADFASFGELARDVARFWLGWNKTPAGS